MNILQFNRIPKVKYKTQEIHMKSIVNIFYTAPVMVVKNAASQRVSGYD